MGDSAWLDFLLYKRRTKSPFRIWSISLPAQLSFPSVEFLPDIAHRGLYHSATAVLALCLRRDKGQRLFT